MSAHSLIHSKKSIEITHIVNPQLFWFKYKDNSVDKTYAKLEKQFQKYVDDFSKDTYKNDRPIQKDSIVLVYIQEKWIRAKVEEIADQTDENSATVIWAIDHGMLMESVLVYTIPLNDEYLAKHPAINVHIGGLSHIAPAELFLDTCSKERGEKWSQDATDYFRKLISGVKDLVFEVDTIKKDRHFGNIEIHANNGKIISTIERLSEHLDAIFYENYKNDIPPLDRESYRRLHHDTCVVEQEFERNSLNIEQDISHLIDDFDRSLSDSSEAIAPATSVRSQNRSQIVDTSRMVLPELFGIPKNVNRADVVVITDDEIVQTIDWAGTFYFSPAMQKYLKKLLKNVCQLGSFVWPHVMRLNSAIMIAANEPCNTVSLPALCTRVMQILDDNPKYSDPKQSNLMEPIAILFAASSAQTGILRNKCRNVLKNSDSSIVRVVSVDGTDISTKCKKMYQVDILVTTVFCFDKILKHFPGIIGSNRLQYVQFQRIDEMYRINDEITRATVNTFLSRKINTQTIFISETYCPILNEIYAKCVNPLMIISKYAAFDAAILAGTDFSAELLPFTGKCIDLIDKLAPLYGSIVIVCKNLEEISDLSEYLFQIGEDHLRLEHRSANDRTAMDLWIISSESEMNRKNILLIDDIMLPACLTRYAQHIIHFSLPKDLKTFLKRFQTCLVAYEQRLDQVLNKRHAYDQVPRSIVYFDGTPCDDLIEMLSLLHKRAKCKFSTDLMQTMMGLLEIKEKHKSFKPLCKELITKAIDCDHTCPYRHWLEQNDNDHVVPTNGFVKLKLLEILSPNHFIMKILGHQLNDGNKWEPMPDMKDEWKRFNKRFIEFYEQNKKHDKQDPVQLGDTCAAYFDNMLYRCRIIAIDTEMHFVTVYLLDIGTKKDCHFDELLHLYGEFHVFPFQTIEVFFLGFVPQDSECNFSKFAQTCIETYLNSAKGGKKYFRAEVITGFERVLLVKRLGVVDLDRMVQMNVLRNLLKNGVVAEVPIKLHRILAEKPATKVMEKYQFDETDTGICVIPEDNDTTMNFDETIATPAEESLLPIKMQLIDSLGFDDSDVELSATEQLLIDFKGNDDPISGPPELFANIRIIKSIDDLLS